MVTGALRSPLTGSSFILTTTSCGSGAGTCCRTMVFVFRSSTSFLKSCISFLNALISSSDLLLAISAASVTGYRDKIRERHTEKLITIRTNLSFILTSYRLIIEYPRIAFKKSAAENDGDDLRIKLFAGHPGELFPDMIQCKGRTVRPVTQHGIHGIRNGHHPCAQWNGSPLQPFRESCPVKPLMMTEDHRHHLLEKFHRGYDPGPYGRMFLDLIKFNGVQHPLFLKDAPLNSYLPDIVDQGSLLQG